jgi:hypothetical protein
VYFQARETVNPFYACIPGAVQAAMDALGERTGRRYRLAEYHGHPEADRVIVVMGSAALLRHGPGHVTVLLEGLMAWMDRKGFGAVGEARGLLSNAAGRTAYGRSGYLSAIEQATRTYAAR